MHGEVLGCSIDQAKSRSEERFFVAINNKSPEGWLKAFVL